MESLKSLKLFPEFFKTGHRGCRGLYPENTIEGFIEAIKLGVNTLEFDIVVSRDGQLVVSHEPYMNPEICLMPDGSFIKPEEEKKYNLYEMSYEQIRKFDCGLKTHPRFPQQKKKGAYKPLLTEVISSIEKYLRENNYSPVIYDIEIKSEEAEYNISQPMPDIFAEMLANFIFQNDLSQKVIIRSFDPAPLKYLHKKYSSFPLALIVENKDPAEENIKRLGFQPYMYSPEYVLLTKNEMDYLRSLDLLVVPWTVNTAEEMKELLSLKVDGLITDYPDLFKTMGI
jgi:glycerophosphoryl diester phosphodiesterase